MHSFARRLHGSPQATTDTPTKGLMLTGGWRYDLTAWLLDTVSFRGQWRQLRQRALALAHTQSGEAVLDVGCGTGTLALEAHHVVGSTGRVAGIDPSAGQIARARMKAAHRHVEIDFQMGVIEQIPFADQTFDVVFSTLMMHHIPAPLKRQGIAEIARVLKPGGRLVIADFLPKRERQGRAAHFHAGGSSLQALVALVQDAGFPQVATEEMPPVRFSAFPGAAIVRADKA